jgi:Na+/H+ antiporter NhaC
MRHHHHATIGPSTGATTGATTGASTSVTRGVGMLDPLNDHTSAQPEQLSP